MTPQIADKLPPFQRFSAFLRKPWRQQKQSIAFRLLRWIPGMIIPHRLPSGAWWLAENDFMGGAVLWAGFEGQEYSLLEQMISPGMTVLDIGAHKGFYTLLFSGKVGSLGRVIAFEPSQRERRRLKLHIKLNSCRNVTVIGAALGEKEEESTLFVVEGAETGMNSLRPVGDDLRTHKQTVTVHRLDSILKTLGTNRVDFIKMDVEGGELGVLRGASDFLDHRPRPYLFAEISDLRTKQWGYEASEILRFMEKKQFHWFSVRDAGFLEPLDHCPLPSEVNFLGVPEERLEDIRDRITNKGSESPASGQKS